jgi:hypothetical protein
MRTKRAKVKPIVYENRPEHPYKKYESHPYWKLPSVPWYGRQVHTPKLRPHV